MDIKVIKTYKISYNIEYFEPTEGGMDSECFCGGIETIEEALVKLETIKLTKPHCDWIITVSVTTELKGVNLNEP